MANGTFSLSEILWPGGIVAATINPRLAVLSGCDTGLSENAQIPDENLGLHAGFLAIRYPGVIGSLWKIDDVATSFLMDKFYFLHLKNKMEPKKALRSAQLWLAKVTHNELIATYGELYPHYADVERSEQSCPYDEIIFWAAFRYFGV